MRHLLLKAYSRCCYTPFSIWLALVVSMALIMLSMHAFADNGSDLLQGTDNSFWTTLKGTGKKYIYGTEFILAIAAYIKSKNLLVFVGVIAIAVFFNILLKFVGE
jgi:hypothetical protein